MNRRFGNPYPRFAPQVIQRQIPVGTHVEVIDPGGNWFGQISATQPGQRYVVRIGGTDRTVTVPENRVRLHSATRAMIESQIKKDKVLTPTAWNIVRSSPEMDKSVEGIKFRRQGLRKVIGQAAYMTGDMIGILAALSLEPDLCVDILVDRTYYVKAYEKDAGALKLNLVQFYTLKHPKDTGSVADAPDPVVWIKTKLAARMDDQSKMMIRTYCGAGIGFDRIRVLNVDDAQKAYKTYEQAFNASKDQEMRPAYFATELVAKAYRKDTVKARAHLAGTMFFSVHPDVAGKIEEFCALRFIRGEKLLLMWGRRSGQNPGGAHPELDTNKYAVTQILNILKRRDPSRKIVIIGDAIFKRLGDSKKAANRNYIDLVDFWDLVWPGHRLDRLEQLYFLHCLNRRCDVIALGMRSGVLEGPALLGMRTLFMEDMACHPEFRGNVGDRMEMWSGGIGETAAIANYRRVQTVAKLGLITEMLSNLQLIRMFWLTRPPIGVKPTTGDSTLRQAAKELSKFASESTLILDPARKRVRFIDPVTLTTMGNPAMEEELGLLKKEKTEATPDPLPALGDRITTCAKMLRSVITQYQSGGASNMPLAERDLLYYVLKDALKVLVRLSPQDLRLVVLNFRRLERFRY